MGDMQAAADWSQPEETDGIRLTWNLWPNSKLEATKCVIPFAAMYTPNKRLPNMPVCSLKQASWPYMQQGSGMTATGQ
jgi:hypothetical protein